MSRRRGIASLVLGLALVLVGSLLLAHNLDLLDVDWLFVLRLVLPTFFLLLGLARLTRHFAWSAAELSEHPFRSGLLSGMFFTSLGVVWHLHVAGVLRFPDFVGLYWPLLLVLFGIGKVVDFYRLRGHLQFRFSEAFGVLLVILFGLGCGLVARAHFPLIEFPFRWDDDFSLADLMGRKFSSSSHQVVAASGIEELEVVNLYGDVRLEPGVGEEIAVDLTCEVRAPDEAGARELAESLKMTSEKEGKRLRIGTNRREIGGQRARFSTHLSVRAPATLRLRIRNGYGDVSVSGFQRGCSIENSYGDVLAEDIQGEVAVENKYRPTRIRGIQGNVKVVSTRGRVEVERVSADAEIGTQRETIVASHIGGSLIARNRFGQIRASSVRGQLHIEAPGSTVRVSRIGQAVRVKNSYNPVSFEDLEAGLKLETSHSRRVRIDRVAGGVDVQAAHTTVRARRLDSGLSLTGVSTSVDLDGVTGPFEITTSLRPVEVKNFDGKGRIQNEFGEVTLQSGGPLTHELVVVNKNAGIVLALPAESHLSLAAESPGGSIASDFGTTQADSTVLRTSIGRGGPEVNLQTTHASIRIKKQR